MATAIATQAKAALVVVCGLILLKVSLLKTALFSGMPAFVVAREILVPPVVLATSLLVFAWVCWATWRTSRADNDIRGVLKLLVGFDALLFLLVFFAEYLA